MHKKHQARLSQLARNRQPPPWPPLDGKCFLQINLAATATEARDAFGLNRLDNSIARPLGTKRLWTHKGIVLVIGMLNVFRWYCHTQARHSGELIRQDLSVLAANGEPLRKLFELNSTNRRLHFAQTPICPKRFMEPAESRSVFPMVNRLVALSVILQRPHRVPQFGRVCRYHASLAGG